MEDQFHLSHAVLLPVNSAFKEGDPNTALQKGSFISNTYLLKAPSGQDEGAACPVVLHQTNTTL